MIFPRRATHSRCQKDLRALPHLETLEDRFVPAMVDLTTRGAEGVLNDALFRQCDAQPTGTGVIRSFVRLQPPNGTVSVEQGYNTDARPVELDAHPNANFNRSLRLADVPRVVVNGVTYREFLLDINQQGTRPLLSLDELRVYVGGSPNLTGYNASLRQLAGLDPVYDLDAGGDNWVKLNYRLNSGSGSGDMFALVPDRLFPGGSADSYVYLYSKFGLQYGANAGFEEWAVRTGTGISVPTPPAPSSLSGYVYEDNNDNGLREAGELGIAGVIIQLQGVDDLGSTVVLTTTTDANGFYRFANLRPGTYSILEVQPDAYFDGLDSIGTQGGSVDNDRLFDINLLAGINGVENNFGELRPVN